MGGPENTPGDIGFQQLSVKLMFLMNKKVARYSRS